MAVKNKDFVELEFSGKIKDGELFDTTRADDAKKLNIDEKSVKPLIVCVGQDMLVKGFDKDLIGKEVGKEYTVNISAVDAFGKRDPLLVQMVSLKNFSEQKIFPQKDMQFSFDGRLAKIVSVSGGRVLVDFNNILAGKDISYDYKILRIIQDKKEKLDSLQEFFFKRVFESELKEDKFFVNVEKRFSQIFELMKKRFEDILETSININVVEDKKDKE